MQAIKSQGLSIPEDVAIVGFDDVSIARYMDPFLTTVRLPAYRLGWKAGELALQLINHEIVHEEGLLLPTKLVIRASCGAIQ
jgi:DNA-binding LacI/PurR family transcriptional regulator